MALSAESEWNISVNVPLCIVPRERIPSVVLFHTMQACRGDTLFGRKYVWAHVLMNTTKPASVAGQHFDVVVVGSGFGSAFFLHGTLKRRPLKILNIEWGDHHSHEWQVAESKNSLIPVNRTYRTISSKPWNFTIGFGGRTN